MSELAETLEELLLEHRNLDGDCLSCGEYVPDPLVLERHGQGCTVVRVLTLLQELGVSLRAA